MIYGLKEMNNLTGKVTDLVEGQCPEIISIQEGQRRLMEMIENRDNPAYSIILNKNQYEIIE